MSDKSKQLYFDKAQHRYFDFDEYIRQGEPEAAASAEQWQTAIGLQAVDGLKPSNYLIDTARRNIEGEITMDEVQELLRSYYASAENRDNTEDDEEADKASANIKRILSTRTLAFNTNGYIATHRRIFEGVMKHAGELRKYDITKKEWVLKGDTVNYLNWEDLRRGIDYDYRYLELFFRNLLLGEEHELKNRYLIIDAPDNWNISVTGEHHEPAEKLGDDIDDLLERLGERAKKLGKRLGRNRIDILRLIYEDPTISTVQMADKIGISTTAIDKNIRQMRDIFIRHVGPSNGGHWEVID